MNGWTLPILVSALLTLTALSGCGTSLRVEAGAESVLDRMDPHLRRCAGALTGEDMPAAREACLPVFAIYEAGRG